MPKQADCRQAEAKLVWMTLLGLRQQQQQLAAVEPQAMRCLINVLFELVWTNSVGLLQVDSGKL